jgi:hypothetical protein
MKLSRRSTFAFLGGGALALGGGVTFVATMSDEELVHAVLERHLGRLEMTKEDIAAFLSDFRERRPWLFPSGKLATVYGVAERLDIADITREKLPGGRGDDLERFERHLLGEFHAKTDVAFRSSIEDPIQYLGSGACLNPFATFV